MIIGRYSALKGFSLLLIVLVAVLDVIFARTPVVSYLNCGVVVVVLGMIVYDLYVKWSKETYGDV